MKIGIIDSRHNCYVTDPDIERGVFGDAAEVTLYQVSDTCELPAEAYACDGFISWHLVPLNRAFFQDVPRCRAVVRAAVGFDNIDLLAAVSHGVQVANVPDYGTEEVADHTLALALGLLRRVPRGHAVVSGGGWDWRQVGTLPRLSQLRVGLVGCGRIGMAVARRFQAFGCQVSFYDPYVSSGTEKSLNVQRCENLDDLLRDSDLVSLHTPLNDETRHLIGARELQRLHGKYLVNTARGPLIDGTALADAVAAGHLRGVGLDVYENEREAIPKAFCNREEVILSPHVAFYSEAALPELRRKAAGVLLDILRSGRHRNVVQP